MNEDYVNSIDEDEFQASFGEPQFSVRFKDSNMQEAGNNRFEQELNNETKMSTEDSMTFIQKNRIHQANNFLPVETSPEIIRAINSNFRTVGDDEFDEAYGALFSIFQQRDEKRPKYRRRKHGESDSELKYGKKYSSPQPHNVHLKQSDRSHVPKKENDIEKQLGADFQRSIQSIELGDASRKKKAIFQFSEEDLNITESQMFPKDYNSIKREKMMEMYGADEDILDATATKRIRIDNNIKMSKKNVDKMIVRLNTPSRKWRKVRQENAQLHENMKEGECTFSPTINPKSKRIRNPTKFYDRVENIIKVREAKTKEKRNLRRKEKDKENTFRPKINRKSKGLLRGVDNFEIWNEKKKEKIEEKRKKARRRKHSYSTFKPDRLARARTERIIRRRKKKKKSTTNDDDDVFTRNYNASFTYSRRKKAKKKKLNKSFGFEPQISKMAKSLDRTVPIGDWLYSYHERKMSSSRGSFTNSPSRTKNLNDSGGSLDSSNNDSFSLDEEKDGSILTDRLQRDISQMNVPRDWIKSLKKMTKSYEKQLESEKNRSRF